MKVIALTLALATPCAHAVTGNHLHQLMSGDNDTSNKLAAVMYVAGITDGIAVAQYLARDRSATHGDRAVCLPAGSQVSQSYEIIKTYLADNPANRHLDAGALSAFALHRVWPCR